MINLDLWWTFRALKVRRESSRVVKRYAAYAAVTLVVPTIFVVTGITMDLNYA